MGQRLIITVWETEHKEAEDKPLMKIYYHWSAYTASAYYEAQRFVDTYYDNYAKPIFKKLRESKENLNEKDRKLLTMLLIRLFEQNDVRIHENDYDYMKKEYPKFKLNKDNLNRNNGMIGLSDETMRHLQEWSEGNLEIYLKEEKIENNVYFVFHDKEEIMEWCEGLQDEDFEDLEDYEEIFNTTFDKLDETLSKVNTSNEFYTDSEGYIYEFVK